MIWIIIFILAIIVLGILVEPFFRAHKNEIVVDDQDYLATQIEDIARDKAAGLISAEEADAADAEARRRLLSAAKTTTQEVAEAGVGARQASTMIIAAAPLAAIALYVFIGNPTLQLTPEAAQAAARKLPQGLSTATAATAPTVAASIADLENRLSENPDDLDGWITLAENYANQNQFTQAATAFGRARALSPELAFLHAAEGEAIAMSGGGIVTPEAQAAFDRALALDEKEPRARFYKAIAADQRGEREEALAAMVAIANEAPADAPWLAIVRSQIEVIANEIGRPLDDVGLRAPPDPIAELEAEIATGDAPYERWVALIEAYAATGDQAKTTDALERAKTRYVNAPFVLQELAALEQQLGSQQNESSTVGPTADQIAAAQSMSEDARTDMIQNMVGGLAARLEAEPDDVEGWTMLARSYGVLGRSAESANAYARAVALSPNDIDLRIGYAEALLTDLNSRDQEIDDTALEAINAVAALQADHPFALYFQGLVAQQNGDAALARTRWSALMAGMPEGSANAARIQEMIDAL